MYYKYEIITENTGINTAVNQVKKHLFGFSVTKHFGFWSGKLENSITITYIGSKRDRHLIRRIAENIRSFDEQDSVLVVTTKVKMEFMGD